MMLRPSTSRQYGGRTAARGSYWSARFMAVVFCAASRPGGPGPGLAPRRRRVALWQVRPHRIEHAVRGHNGHIDTQRGWARDMHGRTDQPAQQVHSRKMIKSFSEQIRRISHVKRCAAQTTARDEVAVVPRAGSPIPRG